MTKAKKDGSFGISHCTFFNRSFILAILHFSWRKTSFVDKLIVLPSAGISSVPVTLLVSSQRKLSWQPLQVTLIIQSHLTYCFQKILGGLQLIQSRIF